MSVTIDADGSGNTTEECAEAILNSFEKFERSIKVLSG